MPHRGEGRYLGPHGSTESRARYDDLMAEWLARQDVSRVTLTVDDLALLFIEFADGYDRRTDGTPTGTVANIRHAVRFAVRMHGRTRVRDFGPLALKAVRQAMIADGRCRTNINRLVHGVRRAFSGHPADARRRSGGLYRTRPCMRRFSCEGDMIEGVGARRRPAVVLRPNGGGARMALPAA